MDTVSINGEEYSVYIKELYLRDNNLTSIPQIIGNLINLKELDLDNNNLISIPQSIGNLSNLERLYLGGNEFTSLPENTNHSLECPSLKEISATFVVNESIDYTPITLVRDMIEYIEEESHFCDECEKVFFGKQYVVIEKGGIKVWENINIEFVYCLWCYKEFINKKLK